MPQEEKKRKDEEEDSASAKLIIGKRPEGTHWFYQTYGDTIPIPSMSAEEQQRQHKQPSIKKHPEPKHREPQYKENELGMIKSFVSIMGFTFMGHTLKGALQGGLKPKSWVVEVGFRRREGGGVGHSLVLLWMYEHIRHLCVCWGGGEEGGQCGLSVRRFIHHLRVGQGSAQWGLMPVW